MTPYDKGSARRWRSAGVAIACMPLIFYATKVAGVILEANFLIAMGLTAYAALRDRAVVSKLALLIVTLYFSASFASIALNLENYADSEIGGAVVSAVNATIVLLVGAYCAPLLGRTSWRMFEAAAIVVGLFLPIALIVGWNDPRAGDRFMGGGMHPNWWGSVSFGAVCCSVFVRDLRVRALIVAAAFATCMAASSRGSMLGMLVVIGFPIAKFLVQSRQKAALLSAGLIALALVFMSPLGDKMISFVLNDMFQNDNIYRGSGTGFTGRSASWQYAYTVFLKSPLVGMGYGQLPEVHNAYLLTLGEMGIFGLIVYLSLNLVTIFNPSTDFNARIIIISYFVFAMFAPRAINLVFGSIIPSLLMSQGWTILGQKRPRIQNQVKTPLPHPALVEP